MVGNVIRPKGESSGGGGIPYIDDMPSFSMTDTSRFERVNGGWKQVGKKCYVNILLKLKFNLTSASDVTTRLITTWQTYVTGLPIPKYDVANVSLCFIRDTNLGWNTGDTSFGGGYIFKSSSGAELRFTNIKDINGTTENVFFLFYGEYDTV